MNNWQGSTVETHNSPYLMVIIDTEEEFDWSQPFSRENTATESVKHQGLAQKIFEKHGVVPTYVLDYCVVSKAENCRFFKELNSSGACEIGAHLHPWVTPPHDETVSNPVNSFHGNLAKPLEREKIRRLGHMIREHLDIRPEIFKAGRYGIGPNTAGLLNEAGYKIDCSYVPYTCFSHDHGPSFLGTPDQPFWLDHDRTLLEIPVTKYFIGGMSGFGPKIQGVFDHPGAVRFRLPGLLRRMGIERSVLSPEGVGLPELIRLIRAMLRHGKRVFTLTYHSPSLLPGSTPYVNTQKDLDAFLACIDGVLEFFIHEAGGTPIPVSRFYRLARQQKEALPVFTRPPDTVSNG